MKKIVAIMIVSGFLSVLSLSANSSNFSFFSNTTISYFTKDDWKLSKAAQNDALNHYKDGMKVIWKNPRTGNYGVFLPSHTVQASSGSVCRNLKIMNTANRMHENATYKFCKLENEWKIV
jgi:surface antigen